MASKYWGRGGGDTSLDDIFIDRILAVGAGCMHGYM